MFSGKTRFKELANSLEKIRKKKAALTIGLMLFGVFSTFAQEQPADDHVHNVLPTQEQVDSIIQTTIVSKEHAERFGALVIQDEGGRMKPIHTFASEVLRKISGKNTYKNLDANQVFLSMMMNPGVWYNTEFVALAKRENDSIRKIIDVHSGTKFVNF